MPAWQTFEREGKGSFRREGNATGARGGGRTCVCITESLPCVPDVIVLGLGTGRYLTPVGGGGRRILGGDHLIFGRTKGGTFVTENPKGWISEKFGRSKRGDNSNLLEK